ncbi:HHR183Cp [Eremothecium sinecaudum]|uniref:HHR183Cp n=1 Tax=Eremothecium sinecaudum TaxID=45286 RepID=A0A109UYQ0_9SACH|nr:HHR183Cp [Eremothecium sinecaudum]AMD22952.1 HHR183Cp [Eremothecium sinecaudum]
MDVSPNRYAPHLSEFYSIFNNPTDQEAEQKCKGDSKGEQSVEPDFKSTAFGSPGTKAPILLADCSDSYSHFRRPSSIRSTTTSMADLQTLVTKKDMQKTHEVMNKLVEEVGEYANTLLQNAMQASNVAFALENIAHLKGCNDDSANKFINVSGVFHLLANHDRIIANLVTETLAPSLKNRTTDFSTNFKDNETQFKKKFKEETVKLKLQEGYNMKLAKQKTRNIFSYRENLMNMQQLLDSLETLKHDYYQESYALVEGSCQEVLKDMATLTRAQVEISENLARKGWSGGGLDDLIVDAEDPFSKDKTDDECDDSDNYQIIRNELNDTNAYRSIAEDIVAGVYSGSVSSDKTVNGDGRHVDDSGLATVGEVTSDGRSEQETSSGESAGNVTITHSSLKSGKLNETDISLNLTPAKSIEEDYSYSLPLAGSKGHLHDDRNSKKKNSGDIDQSSDQQIDTEVSGELTPAVDRLDLKDLKYLGPE